MKFYFFVLLYFVALFGLHLSGDSLTGHFPSFSADAPSHVGGFSGERSAKFFQQYIWQFQRGFFRGKRDIDLYIDLDWLPLVLYSR